VSTSRFAYTILVKRLNSHSASPQSANDSLSLIPTEQFYDEALASVSRCRSEVTGWMASSELRRPS
jgi:hypothetical protein